jgi:hypothetical protein
MGKEGFSFMLHGFSAGSVVKLNGKPILNGALGRNLRARA